MLRIVCCTVVLITALGGCAETRWTKAGATDGMRESTAAQCEASASLQVPVDMETKQIVSASIIPNAAGAPRFIAPSYATGDVNEDARASVFKGCMYANGWQAQ